MMIVFVILIYFNGLLVSSEGNYLPFLHPTNYSILDGRLDWAVNVSLPSPIKFGSSCHTEAWISTNGLISLGTIYTAYSPNFFSITTPVIAPYWDDNDLRQKGQVHYAIITPTTNLSLCNQVNDYLSNSTGSSVSVEWILWAYWYDVCQYRYEYCHYTESNYFQVVLAHQSNVTYAVFIYKCGLIRWTREIAGVGINSGDGYYIIHPLANTYNVTNIDCYDAVSEWTNIVYRLDQDKFEFLSITPHSITVSWNIIPNNNSTLILSITDSLQTVNETINVTEYDNVYNFITNLFSCNVYTFKLALPVSSECNDSIRIISTDTYNVKDIIIERNEDIVCFACVTEVYNECQLIASSTTTTLIPQSIQTNGTCYSFTDNGTYTVYAHDIENGIKILTPAIVIEYTVDWIKPPDTENTLSSTKEFILYQTSSDELILSMEPSLTTSAMLTTATNSTDYQSQSQIIVIILGGLLGLTTFTVLVLSLAMIAILRKKGKTNSIPQIQEANDISVTTKEDPVYEMMNDIPSNITNNYYEAVAISTTDNSMVYDVPGTKPQVSSYPYKVGHF
uniref:NIDO domain-containing protein n=2 Tax=Amphimedon queenslandica TaxID=400682 RepID=A0A1X7ULA0_AMPQE